MKTIETLESRLELPHLKKLRVAAYVRVSSGKEMAIHSLANQADAYRAQILSNPEWELVDVYEDKGISGTIEQRPEYQRMLSDCRAGKIDLIITKSITRFARNTVVLLSTLRELKLLGINVIFEKDHVNSLSESGELLITLLAAFAQAESESASLNQRWRIKKMFEIGRPTTGKMLGYRLVNGILTPVPKEAEVVKEIYRDFIDGMGRIAIAKRLRELKIPSFKNGEWTYSSIRRILTNEKYTGDMLLQKTYTKSYLDKRTRENKGELTQYYVRNSHEAIISKEVFEATKSEMAKRTTKSVSKYKCHPFSSLIVCGCCGKHYRRKLSGAHTKYEKVVWLCDTLKMWGKEYCNSKQIPENALLGITCNTFKIKGIDNNLKNIISAIHVPKPGQLVYVLKDGPTRKVSWENKSRSESWTPEMRQKARERALKRNRGMQLAWRAA